MPQTNYNVYVPVVSQGCQVVLGNHGGGQHPNGDVHIFVTGYWCAEIKVFQIGSQEACIGSGHNSVEQ
jgi:hypothetical protein